MSKRFILLIACLVAATSVTAGTVSASPRLMIGIYDEAQTLYGNPDRTFPTLRSLRTEVLRVGLYWGGKFGVAKRRPTNATNPDDRAYNWAIYDRTVNYAAQYGMRIVFSIWGTPTWANGGKGLNYAPRSALDLQRFATAAARRYSGTWTAEDGRALPAVRMWLAWNEPNNPAFLLPQYRRVGGKPVIQSAVDYAKICNAVTRGVKATFLRGEQVACGVTAPRGNNSPNTERPSVAPLPFLRAMKRAGAKGFDVYAHHPYYLDSSETPTTVPKGTASITLANIDVLLREITRLYGNKKLWITEYGYQTNPPDRTKFGVSWANQARYLGQAFAIARKNPRIDMMLWFQLRDEPRAEGWQSGFLTFVGRRKPSFTAFQRLRHSSGVSR